MTVHQRFPVSGAVTAALITASKNFNLLGATITSGRVLWLKKVWLYSAAGPGVAVIGDVAPGQTGMSCVTGVAAASPYTRLGFAVTASGYRTFDIPEPGIKFTGYCTIANSVTSAEANFAAAGGEGYEY